MRTIAVRLRPGQDLKRALVELVDRERISAGYVLTCVGSLDRLALRLAGATRRRQEGGLFEIVSLTGTLAPDGVHLHLSAADADGRTIGGHLVEGCTVRTTAEVVVADDDRFVFRRAPDPDTGYDELVISPSPRAPSPPAGQAQAPGQGLGA